MGALDLSGLPENALLLVDAAPIIYRLERHPILAERFAPVFDLQTAGRKIFPSQAVVLQHLQERLKDTGERATQTTRES